MHRPSERRSPWFGDLGQPIGPAPEEVIRLPTQVIEEHGEAIQKLLQWARAEEREACAKLADQAWEADFGMQRGLTKVGDLIRARKA